MGSCFTQVVGCTKNMIRTVRKMKAEGKSLEPNFKGGTKRIGRDLVLDKGHSIYDNGVIFTPWPFIKLAPSLIIWVIF